MLLVTVRHTGTTSLKKQYPGVKQLHCGEDSFDRTEKIITTYRNPDEVAESWLNRGWFEHEKFKRMWYEGWKDYKSLSKLNVEVKRMQDLEHHLNHVEEADNEGMFLNDDMINYAHKCSEWANV
jgi:hypothetical protein